LVVHASIRCEPRASLDAVIDRHGVRPAADDIIPPRAAELISELGSCTLQLRPKQDASLRWTDVTSAAELEAGARFLQLIATNKSGAGAFRLPQMLRRNYAPNFRRHVHRVTTTWHVI
jgi:hypothetical protein